MDFSSSNTNNNQENLFELQLGPSRGMQRSRLNASVAAPSASSSASSTLEAQPPFGTELALELPNGSSSEDPLVPPGFEGSEVSCLHVQHREVQLHPLAITYAQQTSDSNGVWFCLISVPNEEGVSLPQLDKAYIRVRKAPGATQEPTVLIVKKFLARKFRLSDADIDLSCMGLPLENPLLLTFVRDYIWHPRIAGYFLEARNNHEADALSPSDININLMRLHYALGLDP